MDENDIRKGNTQSSFDTEQSNLFMFQFLALAVAAGYQQSSDGIFFIPSSWSPWAVGGVTLIAGMVLSMIPIIKNITAIGFTLCWGFFGYSLMDAFDASAGATWTVAIILCLSGGGVNLSGMRWAEDI